MSNAKQDQGPEKVCACGAHFRSAYVEICGACLTRNARRFWRDVMGAPDIPGRETELAGQPAKRKRRHGKARTHGGGKT